MYSDTHFQINASYLERFRLPKSLRAVQPYAFEMKPKVEFRITKKLRSSLDPSATSR